MWGSQLFHNIVLRGTVQTLCQILFIQNWRARVIAIQEINMDRVTVYIANPALG